MTPRVARTENQPATVVSSPAVGVRLQPTEARVAPRQAGSGVPGGFSAARTGGGAARHVGTAPAPDAGWPETRGETGVGIPVKTGMLADLDHERGVFVARLPELRQQYPGRFVAVHAGVVVDADESRAALVRRFFERFGDVPVYIGYVGGPPPVAYQVTPLRLGDRPRG